MKLGMMRIQKNHVTYKTYIKQTQRPDKQPDRHDYDALTPQSFISNELCLVTQLLNELMHCLKLFLKYDWNVFSLPLNQGWQKLGHHENSPEASMN